MDNTQQKASLVGFGLTDKEADQFLALLEKVKPGMEVVQDYYDELESGEPFADGITFIQALAALKESQLEN